MRVSFAPAALRTGQSERIVIRLADPSRRPVSGASVLVATSMPAMSMGGPTLKARALRAGVYVATCTLSFATTWNFDVSAKSGGFAITRSFIERVQ